MKTDKIEAIKGQNTVVGIGTISRDEFLKLANKLRLENKDKWVFLSVRLCNGAPIDYKAFNTYIQRLRINDIEHAGGMTEKVKDFKQVIANALDIPL